MDTTGGAVEQVNDKIPNITIKIYITEEKPKNLLHCSLLICITFTFIRAALQ